MIANFINYVASISSIIKDNMEVIKYIMFLYHIIIFILFRENGASGREFSRIEEVYNL